MTRDETKELLMTIQAVYPNFKVAKEQMSITINAWNTMLAEYPVEAVNAAFQIYVKSNNTGFAPSVSQLIGCMFKPTENDQLTEGEAWALVKRAIKDGGYHAEERFNELPPLVQRAVGGASMIHQWAMVDSDEINTVVMSNFQRTYKAILSKQDFNNRVPSAIADVVRLVADKVSPQARLAELEGGEQE